MTYNDFDEVQVKGIQKIGWALSQLKLLDEGLHDEIDRDCRKFRQNPYEVEQNNFPYLCLLMVL